MVFLRHAPSSQAIDQSSSLVLSRAEETASTCLAGWLACAQGGFGCSARPVLAPLRLPTVLAVSPQSRAPSRPRRSAATRPKADARIAGRKPRRQASLPLDSLPALSRSAGFPPNLPALPRPLGHFANFFRQSRAAQLRPSRAQQEQGPRPNSKHRRCRERQRRRQGGKA